MLQNANYSVHKINSKSSTNFISTFSIYKDTLQHECIITNEMKIKKLLDKGNNRKDHKMQIIQLESMKLMYE